MHCSRDSLYVVYTKVYLLVAEADVVRELVVDLLRRHIASLAARRRFTKINAYR